MVWYGMVWYSICGEGGVRVATVFICMDTITILHYLYNSPWRNHMYVEAL